MNNNGWVLIDHAPKDGQIIIVKDKRGIRALAYWKQVTDSLVHYRGWEVIQFIDRDINSEIDKRDYKPCFYCIIISSSDVS